MAHVFISYSHKDRDFAVDLIRHVTEAGFDAWSDKDRLHAGDNWRIEIDNAIYDSFALIVIMSPHSMSSKYVTYEWALALGLDKRVIPVLYKRTRPHPRLGDLHRRDFSHDSPERWDELIEDIKTASSEFKVSQIPRNAPRYVKNAFEALDSPTPQERQAAIDTLAQADHPAARRALVAGLGHDIAGVRSGAAKALASLGEKSAIPVLVKGLGDKKSSVRQAMIDALVEISDKSAIPGLLETLQNDDVLVRQAAANVLKRLGDSSAVQGLVKAMSDADTGVRVTVIEGLGNVGDPAAIPALLNSLDDQDSQIRRAAAEALGETGSSSAPPELVKAIYDKDDQVKHAAASSLARIGDSSVVLEMLKAVCDPNVDTQQAARGVILELGQIAVPRLLEALQDQDANIRRTAADALGGMKVTSAVPALIESLRDPVPFVKGAAAAALREIGTPEARHAIEGLDS